MSARRFGRADIVRVETLAAKTFEIWKSPHAGHGEVAAQVQSLISIFEQLQSVFELDPSLSAQAAGNEDLADLLESAEATLAGLYIFPDRVAAAAHKPQKKQLFRHRQDEQETLRDELKVIREDIDDFARAFSILLLRFTDGSGESQSDQSAVAKAKGVRASMDTRGTRTSIDSKYSSLSVDSMGNPKYPSFSSSISPTTFEAHPGSQVAVSDEPAYARLSRDDMALDTFELHLQGYRASTASRSGNKLRMFYGVPSLAGSEPAASVAAPEWATQTSPDSDMRPSRRPSSNPDERLDGSRLSARRKESTFLASPTGSSEPTSAVETMRRIEDTLPIHRSRTVPLHESEYIAELDGSDLRLSKSNRRPQLGRGSGFTPKTSPRPSVSTEFVSILGPGPSPMDSSAPSSNRGSSTFTAERALSDPVSDPNSCTDPSPISPRDGEAQKGGAKEGAKPENAEAEEEEEEEEEGDDSEEEEEEEEEQEGKEDKAVGKESEDVENKNTKEEQDNREQVVDGKEGDRRKEPVEEEEEEEEEGDDDDEDDDDEEDNEDDDEDDDDGEDEEELKTPTTATPDIASAAPQITPFHFPSPLSPITMEL